MHALTRPKVVVLGTLSTMPAAGVVWQYIHYLKGLELLGYESWYVEDHAIWPKLMVSREDPDGSFETCRIIDDVMRRFGLGERWAYRARHSTGVTYPIGERQLGRILNDAALIINLHGATVPREEHAIRGRLVYLETDPVEVQVGIAEGDAELAAFLEPHAAFFSFGENIGLENCSLPRPPGMPFWPTRQPVIMGMWSGGAGSPRDTFTTIASWRQKSHPVVWQGQALVWSKHEAFRRFLDMPARTGLDLELALAKFKPEDKALLIEQGWRVIDASELSFDELKYRDYIKRSAGEFTVAKDQYVVPMSGWFSDRSATYLAAGRPVVTQDTGYSRILPTGKGLMAFTSPDEAAAALTQVARDRPAHERAALEIARGYFGHDVVLGQLLSRMDLPSRPTGAPVC